MSNKVTFSTNKYVQEEIAKIRLELEQNTVEGLDGIKQEHENDVRDIRKEIESLKKTVNDDLSSSVEETSKIIEDLKETVSKDLEDLSRNILVENIEYRHNEYSDIANVKNALDKLLYTDLAIALTASLPTTNEMGTTLSGLTFSWDYNREVNTQSIDGVQIHRDSRIYRYPTNITSDKTVTLSVNDFVKDYSKSMSFKFLNGAYYGVSNATSYDSDLVLGFTKQLTDTRARTFTVNAGVGQHIFYCIPTRFGNPTFLVGGFEGGFSKAATIEFTNVCGYTEQYAIWKSVNANLGNTTVTVK